MPPKKKSKKSNKRKAPEPSAAAAGGDGAGPSNAVPPADPPSAAEGAGEQQEDTLDTRRKTALAMLLQLGLPEERALRALEATADEHSAEAETWAEEAGFWLAVDNECADESYAMGAAMQISLVEAEERKATEKPLIENTGREILEKFTKSELLEALGRILKSKNSSPKDTDDTKPSTSAGKVEKKDEEEEKSELDVSDLINELDDASPTKKALVDYLLMEQRCKKWYACSRGYFANFAQNVQSKIVGEVEGAKKKRREDVDEKEAKVGGPSSGKDEKIAGTVPNVSLLSDTTLILVRNSDYLQKALTDELAVLQEAVFNMPENDNAGVPAIFTAYANVQEEVVLVDD